MMKKLNNILLILFAIAFLQSKAQSILDYNSFLSQIKKENLLVQKAYNNIPFSQQTLNAAKGNFDPQINSSIENKTVNSSQYFTVGNVELKQQLYTSQYLKVGYQYGQGNFVNPQNYTPLDGLPYVGIQANLLQGLLFDKNRAEVIKGKHYVEYYKAEGNLQLNELFLASANSYCNYLFLKKQNNLYYYFLNLAAIRLKAIKELSLVGEKPTIDTIEAAIFYQARLLDTKAGELELTKTQNDLLTFIQSSTTDTKYLIVSDSIDLIYTKVNDSLYTYITKQTNNNPLLNMYSAKQKVLDTEVRLKKEMIKPVLNVDYNFLNNNNTNTFPNLSVNNYKWGAKFTLPLYLRTSRNEYKIANIIAENNRFELEYKQNQINFKRNYLREAIALTSQQIQTAEKTSAYNQKLVEAEKIKFDNGESSLFLLNSRENKWLEAELKLNELKHKFILLYFELIFIDGNLNYELL